MADLHSDSTELPVNRDAKQGRSRNGLRRQVLTLFVPPSGVVFFDQTSTLAIERTTRAMLSPESDYS